MRSVLIGMLMLLPLGAQGLVEVEATRWQARLNEVRKPAQGGTTFELGNLLGSDPIWAGRMAVSWDLGQKHGIRILLAPFETTGTGVFPVPVTFQGSTFSANVPMEGRYRFNSWRATWRYTWVSTERWTVKVGATAKIRDAKVELRQGGLSETTKNIGFVPLAHLYVERRMPGELSAVFETDALAAPQGRAVDAALMLRWQFNRRTYLDVGYCLLEGGADSDQLYTWARLDGWRAGVGVRF